MNKFDWLAPSDSLSSLVSLIKEVKGEVLEWDRWVAESKDELWVRGEWGSWLGLRERERERERERGWFGDEI